ncbi:MAG: hypothetical protein NZ605_08300, partial [Acidimicrobiales bacterium]|nr:hypothetical protein [Acidimicrobiales bacterium]
RLFDGQRLHPGTSGAAQAERVFYHVLQHLGRSTENGDRTGFTNTLEGRLDQVLQRGARGTKKGVGKVDQHEMFFENVEAGCDQPHRQQVGA